jgi:branched-subunit amino acid transport protein
MEISRSQIILIMGLMAFAVRSLPQVFFVGKTFPEPLDRWLRYISYAFICSIISITLFLSDMEFEAQAAPRRALALGLAVFVSHKTKSAAGGMICGVLLLLILSWFR